VPKVTEASSMPAIGSWSGVDSDQLVVCTPQPPLAPPKTQPARSPHPRIAAQRKMCIVGPSESEGRMLEGHSPVRHRSYRLTPNFDVSNRIRRAKRECQHFRKTT